MNKQSELALKGAHVEEWIDLRFFRPLGVRIARALLPTRVSPNHISLVCLVLGVAAAHLFLYEGWAINVAGFVLIVVADLLDSSDGQLARLRGSASRTGRLFDGFVDNVRWIAVYVHLASRAMLEGHGLWVLGAAAVAGYFHGLHSNAVDIVTFGYLDLRGDKRAVDLPEDIGEPPAGWFWRHAWPFYTRFVQTQGRMFPRTVAAVRRTRQLEVPAELRQRFAAQARDAVRLLPAFGQNIHIVALGAAGIAGLPLVYFAFVAVVVTAAAYASTTMLERAAAALSAGLDVTVKQVPDEPAAR
jgi:hypothetical protein